MRVKKRPPVEKRRAQKADVLKGVNQITAERLLKQIRHVSAPEHYGVNQPGCQRQGEKTPPATNERSFTGLTSRFTPFER